MSLLPLLFQVFISFAKHQHDGEENEVEGPTHAYANLGYGTISSLGRGAEVRVFYCGIDKTYLTELLPNGIHLYLKTFFTSYSCSYHKKAYVLFVSLKNTSGWSLDLVLVT